MTCPGSVQLIAKLIEQGYDLQRSTVYAREGTAAHELAARCLRSGVDAFTFIGQWMSTETPEPVEVTEEMAEAVQVYVDYVRGISQEPKDTLYFVEHVFDLGAYREGMFGTADCAALFKPTSVLHVVDYKHGAGIAVDAENNPQLKYYGLGALLKLHGMGLDVALPQRVQLTIVQPRAFHPQGSIRSVVVTAGSLITWGDDLIEAAEATDKPDAPLVPGEHCRFCPAISRCPRLYQNAVEAARLVFDDVPEPNITNVHGPLPVKDLNEEQLRRALMVATILEPWFKELWATAQAKLERGQAIDGWKLVAKQARRKWGADDFIVKAELGKLGVTDVYEEPALRSPAQIEKLLPAAKRAAITPLIVKESSGITLVSAGDKRPAIHQPLPFEVLPEE